MNRTRDQHWRPQGTALTCRERQIIALCALGYSNAEIGILLYVSAETVKSHMRHVLAKLGARTRAEAVYRAISTGSLGTPSASDGSDRSRTYRTPCVSGWSGVPDDLLRILGEDSPS